MFVTRQRDHNPSEYTNLHRNCEQQHVGFKVFRGPLGQWLPWAERSPGSGALPYNRSGVLPPIRPIVTSVRYMSPGGHDISPQAFRQGTPATVQTVSGPLISVPLPPTQVSLVSSVPKRARSPAKPRDSNDDSHAFKSGVGGINYFCPDRNRSRRLTADGEQVVESQKRRRTSSWTVIPEMMVPPGCRAPPLSSEHLAGGTPTVALAGDINEETVPGEVGYALPRDLGIRTLLFETAATLSKHTGRARASMQALWSRLKEGGQQVPEVSWDLEQGGHSTSEVGVGDLLPSATLSPVLSIPTINYGSCFHQVLSL